MPGDIVSDRVNELYRGEIFEPQTQRACRDRVHWMCMHVAGNDVLDIGCSQGITSLLLGREGHRVVGVDVDPAAVEYAAKELEKEAEYVRRNVRFQTIGGEPLPFPDESFDTVILGEILEHLTRPERILAEASRLLHPGGRVVITTPYGVHPHPGHVRTFYLSSFLGLVGQFFGAQALRIVDGYITYVGVKNLSDSGDPSPECSHDKMLLLAENAFHGKEQRYWEHRESLSRQAAALRQDVAKARAELDALRKDAGQSADRVRRFEQQLAEWHKTVASMLAGVRRSLQGSLVESDCAFLCEQLDGLAAELAKPSESFFDRVLHLVPELARVLGTRLRQAGEERDSARTAFAELQKKYDAEVAELRSQRDRNVSGLLAKHESEMMRLRAERDSAQAAFAELQKKHDAEVAELRSQRDRNVSGLLARHEAEMDRVRAERDSAQTAFAELQKKHDAEVAELRSQRDRDVSDLLVKHEAEMDRLRADLVRRNEEKLAAASREHETAIANLRRAADAEAAQARVDVQRQTAELRSSHEAELCRLRDELQKANSRQARAEQAAEQLRTRLNSLVEYYRRSDQLRQEEVRYLLGDAFVRAVDSPKDLICLPGRIVRLFFAGRRRRRERRIVEQGDTERTERPRPSASSAAPATVRAAGPAAPATPPPSAASAPGSAASSPSWRGAATSAAAGAACTPPPATSILEKAPFAPHIGMGMDLRETVFARPPAGPRRKVGIILDEFSRDCFAPEFEPVTFRPDNWANVLRTTGAEMLLVESAWHGNDGSWQYRIASYQKNTGDELLDLLACCKRNGVPTVFWNKEDPAHFDRFIDKARLFDVVLTTDADCIPRYRERVGHDRVYALPFAAQPAIHNPVQTEPRLPKACFAGTYYATRFEQRQDDMLHLLRPAMRLGLDIFDRMHGAVGVQKDQYRFPDEFQPAIRGRLDYKDMVRAYKQYRVFLNVNSVRQSPTMFSRRVFELLACGTPVVSTYAKGIEELLGRNGVYLAESEASAQRILESLLRDHDAWARASALGIRKVLSEHTYAHRFASICCWAGLGDAGLTSPLVAALVPVRSSADYDAAAQMIASQGYANLEVHLFASANPPKDGLDRVRNAARGRPVRLWNIGGASTDACEEFLKATSAEIVCSMSPDAAYAETYVDEAAMFFRIPGVGLLGKACHFGLSEGSELRLVGSDDENRMVDSVPSATVCARKAALTAEILRLMLTEPIFQRADRSIFSTYRYGYVQAPARRVRGSSWWLSGQEGGSSGR